VLPAAFRAPITLFADFEVVSKQVAFLHYTDDIGIACDMAPLRPVNATPAPQARAT
jgi:hypothetical protein